MTQKELLYVEDAIGHENIIISMIDEDVKKLKDEKLLSFMKKEKKNHTTTLNKLISLLEDTK